jgi:hypothetical protein
MAHVTYDFSSSEHYRASRIVTQRSRWSWLPWIAAILLVVLVTIGQLSTDRPLDPLSVLLSIVPYVGLALVWVAGLPLLQRYAAFNLPKVDPSVRGPQERIVDTDGYHSRGNGVSIDLPWHVMAQSIETEDFFLFYYNKKCAYYLPKRTASDAEIAEIRELIRTRLPVS